MMSRSAVRALDAWRRAQPDLPGRGEAIRRMMERVLDPDKAEPE